ncbi:MAG: hypothetical protein ABJI96_23465 [Paracoccaceae bacterium]
MSDPRPTVVLIGLGGFGALWKDAIEACGLRVVAGIDPDPFARADFHNAYADHAPDVFERLENFAGSVTFFIDSAPPAHRARRVLSVIDRAECVVVAKPAVASLAALDDLMATLGPRADKVRVAMQKRHLPAFEALQTLIDEDALGKLTYIRSLVELDGTFWEPGTFWRTEMAHPNLWEGAIHQIDLLLQWCPDLAVTELSAFGWTPAGSAFAGISDFNVMMRDESGCVAQIIARWSVSRLPITHYFEGVRIEGCHATAEVHGGRIYKDAAHRPVADEGEVFMDVAKLNTRLAPTLFDLENPHPELGLAWHRRVLELADAIQTALER